MKKELPYPLASKEALDLQWQSYQQRSLKTAATENPSISNYGAFGLGAPKVP